jgi:hypothetical protein
LVHLYLPGNEFTVVEPGFEVEPNGILDVLQGFVSSVSLGITSGQYRTGGDENSILVPLKHDRKLIRLHPAITSSDIPDVSIGA